MADVALVRDRLELAALRRSIGSSLQTTRVYTLFAHMFFELEKDQVEPHLTSEEITAGEAYNIYARAFDDTKRLTEDFPLTRRSLKLNLARLFKVHYWEYLSELYALDLAMGRIGDRLGGGKFYHFRPLPSFPQSHLEITDANFLSGWLLEGRQRERGGAFEALHRGEGASKNGNRPWLSFIKREGGRFARYARDFFGEAPDHRGARSIAFGGGYDALLVIPDALRLSEEEGLRPLWMGEAADRDTTRSGLVYKKEYDEMDRISIRQCLGRFPAPSLGPEEKREADGLFDELLRRLNHIPEVRRYDIPMTLGRLRDDFRFALRRGKALEKTLERFSGSALVVTHFNGLDERIIEQIGGRFGIRLHARPHGWMNSFEAFEFSGDQYYCDGSMRARVMDEVYGYGERISILLDPSLREMARAWQSRSLRERRAVKVRGRSALSIKADYVILIMTTAARHGRALNEFDYPKFLDCWDVIFDYLKAHPEIYIVIKSHKRNFDPWLEESAARKGVTNFKILGGRLEDTVVLADLVVDLGKPGSATLVALLLESPLLLYGGLYKYVREFGDLVFDVGESFTVSSPPLLVQELDRFRSDPGVYAADLLKANRKLLLELADTTSLDRSGEPCRPVGEEGKRMRREA